MKLVVGKTKTTSHLWFRVFKLCNIPERNEWVGEVSWAGKMAHSVEYFPGTPGDLNLNLQKLKFQTSGVTSPNNLSTGKVGNRSTPRQQPARKLSPGTESLSQEISD